MAVQACKRLNLFVQVHPLFYKVVFGCKKLYMVVYGCTWLSMVVHCGTIPYIVIQACTWLYKVVHRCKS